MAFRIENIFRKWEWIGKYILIHFVTWNPYKFESSGHSRNRKNVPIHKRLQNMNSYEFLILMSHLFYQYLCDYGLPKVRLRFLYATWTKI